MYLIDFYHIPRKTSPFGTKMISPTIAAMIAAISTAPAAVSLAIFARG